jgi:hypothetical protein
VVGEQPHIAPDLQTALELTGAKVAVVRNGEEALTLFSEARGRGHWSPEAKHPLPIARALARNGVRFPIYATHPPKDVATARGAPNCLEQAPIISAPQ